MTSARKLCLIALAALLAMLPAASLALPVIIPDFASDPSGLQFTIQAVPETNPLSINIAQPPELQYGQTSQPEPVLGTLSMQWDPIDPNLEAQAGWELVFGSDPDLRNASMSLSVLAPGGVDAAGLFVGISTISVVAVDNLGFVAGGWGFNTDQAGSLPPPANDLLAGGGVSLFSNAMHNVFINFGFAPAAGSAIITPIAPPLGGPVIGPNFLIPGNNNFANIGSLQYFENGILRGQTFIPGIVGQAGLINWWDHLSIVQTPEPTTMLLFGGGLIALARKRRKKK